MIWINSGSFNLGSPENDPDADKSEKPQRKIHMQGFWISESEITNDQYEKLLEPESSRTQRVENRKNKQYSKSDPVVYVTWYMAMDFCFRMSELTGKNYLLPTEIQWEYAARAGTTNIYYFGDNNTDLITYAWFEGNADNKLHKIKKRRKNPWGLFDMLGNAQEWCWNWYNPNYYSLNLIDGDKNPLGPRSGTKKVLRGGHIFSSATQTRCASRESLNPKQSSNSIGFRVVVIP